MPYLVGQTYTSAIDVVDKNGQPVTPSTVTLTITHVGTTDAPATPSITAAAHMSYDFTLPSEGLWRFDWLTTNPGAPQTEFVTARAFRSAITLADARDYLGVNDTRTDLVLQSLMMSATLLAEKIVGTIVPTTYTDEWVTGTGRPIIRVSHGPILSSTSTVTIKSIYPGGPTWNSANGDLIINPAHGTIYPASMIDFWLGPWLVTYPGGRLVCPDNISNGIREILWDLWTTQRNLTGDQDYPSITEADAFESQVPLDYHIPGRAAELLEGDRMPAFG